MSGVGWLGGWSVRFGRMVWLGIGFVSSCYFFFYTGSFHFRKLFGIIIKGGYGAFFLLRLKKVLVS